MAVNWEYDHVGLLVKDIASSIDLYRRVGFNLITSPFWDTWEADGHSVKFQCCLIQNNAARIKLIQPENSMNILNESLTQHGEGVFYMSFFTPDLAGEKDRLTNSGFPIIAVKNHSDENDAEIVFNTAGVGGVCTLLFENPTTLFKPSPGRWKLAHLGFVVRDIVKLHDWYKKLGFATGGPPLKANPPLPQETLDLWTIYDNKPIASPDFKMVITNFHNEQGTFQISVNEPAGNVIYDEFISQHGDGIQHLHFVVPDDLDVEKAKMETAGFSCILTQRTDEGILRETYYDTRSSGNVVIGIMLPLPPGIGSPPSR